jgi:hypothetical protein
MTDKKLFGLLNSDIRRRAANAVMSAPDGYMVKIAPPTRNLEQSAKFHAICGDSAKARLYCGKKLSLEQWKVLYISGHAIATGIGAQIVAGLEGEFCNIRESSASMSVARMSSLIEYATAYLANTEPLK